MRSSQTTRAAVLAHVRLKADSNAAVEQERDLVPAVAEVAAQWELALRGHSRCHARSGGAQTASSCCPFKTPEAPPSTEQVSLQPELPRPSTATLYFYGLFSQQQATLGKVSQRQQGLGWGVT